MLAWIVNVHSLIVGAHGKRVYIVSMLTNGKLPDVNFNQSKRRKMTTILKLVF